MCRIGIFYGSNTGNTQEVAKAIANGVISAGGTADIKNVAKAFPEELLNYDGIALGSSTWGDGKFQRDFDFFHDMMDGLDLKGKKAISFGSCDPLYEQFGKAVDMIDARLKELGAEVITSPTKIIRTPGDSDKQQCYELGMMLANHLIKQESKAI